MIDNILNKDNDKLTYKERMLVIEYFRKIVNDEFKEFKDKLLKEDKEFIFEKAYLIDTFDTIKIRLCNLSYLTISYLLKYQKNNFIDYMYNADVTNSVFDYYDNIEGEIIKQAIKIRKENETDYKAKVA